MAKKGGKKAGKKSKVKPDEMMEEVSSTISGTGRRQKEPYHISIHAHLEFDEWTTSIQLQVFFLPKQVVKLSRV